MGKRFRDIVRANSQAKRSARAVMMLLSDYADKDGVAWPGNERIARECGLSERTVTRCIAQLIELGEIELHAESRHHEAPRYRILVCADNEQGRQDDYSEGRQSVIEGRQIDEQGRHPDQNRVDILSSSLYIEPEYRTVVEPRESAGARTMLPARKVVSHKSPYLTPAHFENGYIPPGNGANAVEVYYERFSINQDAARLNALNEDDLVRACTDLERLRAVVTEYSQTTYKPGNVRLILDWYRDGPPSQRRAAAMPGAVGTRPAPYPTKPQMRDQAFANVERLLSEGGMSL